MPSSARLTRSGSSSSSLWASRIFALEASRMCPFSSSIWVPASARAASSLRRSSAEAPPFCSTSTTSWRYWKIRPIARPGEAGTPGISLASVGDGAGGCGRRFGGGLRFLAGLLAAAVRYQGSQGCYRLVGVGAGRLDRDDIALLGGQAHDRDQGLGVDLVVAPDQLDLGTEGLRRRASTAAGRACSPAWFGRGMPSDATSAPVAAASATVIRRGRPALRRRPSASVPG